MNNAPIGVFDSGVGGLSVLRHIRERLPQESLIYVADSAYAPYGEKTAEKIQQRSLLISRFLQQQGVKMLVVACNTATAAAVQRLREDLALPVVGMEPAIKPATRITRNGVIGVLATTGTIESARFAALLDRFGDGLRVITRSCRGWVELVESGDTASAHALASVRFHVQPLLDQGADTLILGCTHYPFLQPAIHAVSGVEVALVETGEAVARRVQQLLSERGSLADRSLLALAEFYTSGDVAVLSPVMRRLWGEELSLQRLPPLPLPMEAGCPGC